MRDRTRIGAALAGVLVLAAVVYSASFRNGFLSWDDPANVTNNQVIRSFSAANIRAAFTQPLLGVYSPLVYLSFALDYRLGGLNPTVYHAVNLALHLVCVLLIYAAIHRLTGRPWAAVVVAALFAVHPANVAAVAPISVRSSLLFSAFYLAGYTQYVGQAFRPADSGKPEGLPYVLIFFLLACLSKPAAIVFPVLMLATDVYRGRRLSRSVLLEKLPFFVVSIVFGVVALTFRTDMATTNPLVTTIPERIALAAYQLGFYVVHAVAPMNLSAYYPYPARTGDPLPATIWLAPVFVAVIIALVVRLRSAQRWLAFGLFVFVLHLALVLKLVPLGLEFTADRYLYVPLLGVGIIAVEWTARVSRPARRATVIGALILMAGWSAMSWRHQSAWRDDMTLYTRIIDRYPQSAIAYANRAGTKLQQKDVGGAWQDSSEAIRLDSTNVQGYFNRATAEFMQGRVRDALDDANRAIALDPNLPGSYALRAGIHLSTQNYTAARDDAGRAIELAPNADDVFKPLVTRGMARAMLGDGAGALADLDRAIAVNPQEPALFYNRGQVRMMLGDVTGGCADLRVAAAGGRDDAAALVKERCGG